MALAREKVNIASMTSVLDSELKLYCHLSEKIVSREIKTFGGLCEFSKTLKLSFNPGKVLYRSFNLFRELHWGFFKELDITRFTKLWKELVISHPVMKGTGDLKRNISISNIYISMMDIHGYTRFCQESKSNLSRLRKLDEFLHDGIKKIAGKNKAIANRERGDEIVVVAASAIDIIKTTLEIINSFSMRSVIKNSAVGRDRSDFSIVLPDFKITAGIAGGNLTTPLIITESGLLAGYLLNTAARLQTLANEYSPKESKIMVTTSVVKNYYKENRVVESQLFARKLIHFFDNGLISFKGTRMSSLEIIFKEREKYRISYEAGMKRLYESLRQELWKQKIFEDTIAVIVEACRRSPGFSIEIKNGPDVEKLTNTSLSRLAERARHLYSKGEYLEAVSILALIKEQLEYIPDFDRLVLSYVREIHQRYHNIVSIYERRLESEIEKKIDSIFNPQYKAAFYNAKKSTITYEKLRIHALKHRAISNRKNIWYSLIQHNLENMKMEIYAGKR